MPGSDNLGSYHESPKWKNNKSLIVSCLVSLISVLLIQFTLLLLPLFMPTSSFLTLLPLSGVLMVMVMGLVRFSKKVAGVRASAPAFVFISIFFIWAVYISAIRRVVSSMEDLVFNTEMILVMIGVCCIMASDPGRVADRSSCHGLFVESPVNDVEKHEEELKISTSFVQQEPQTKEDFTLRRRVKYCRHCMTYVIGFDHHCPAFGNCIGQKNHAFFLVLLVGFVASEVSYVNCALKFMAKSRTSAEVGWEGNVSRNLVLGTMLFSLIQVLWQVIFVVWHLYCACFNIKTDEWINWKKYPEFQSKIFPQAGEQQLGTRFVNPYDKGILQNLKEFITAKG